MSASALAILHQHTRLALKDSFASYAGMSRALTARTPSGILSRSTRYAIGEQGRDEDVGGTIIGRAHAGRHPSHDRQGARPYDPANVARPRRRGDQVIWPDVRCWYFC